MSEVEYEKTYIANCVRLHESVESVCSYGFSDTQVIAALASVIKKYLKKYEEPEFELQRLLLFFRRNDPTD